MTAAPADGPTQLDLTAVLTSINTAYPDTEALVFRDLRLTRAEVDERTNRLADHLVAQGLGCHTERSELAWHETGSDHLAIYMHNRVEYLESMVAAWKARVAPFNVNYRY